MDEDDDVALEQAAADKPDDQQPLQVAANTAPLQPDSGEDDREPYGPNHPLFIEAQRQSQPKDDRGFLDKLFGTAPPKPPAPPAPPPDPDEERESYGPNHPLFLEAQKQRQQTEPESSGAEGAFGSFAREFVHGAPPAIAGTLTGVGTGAVLGSLGAGPIGTFAGGIAGGVAGGYGASKAAEAGLNAAGLDDSAQRAINAQEHPWATWAGSVGSNLLGFGPGAASKAVRAGSAAISAGMEAGQQYAEGKLGTTEGMLKVAGSGALGAAAPKPHGYVTAVEQKAVGALDRWRRPTAAAAAPAAEPPPGTTATATSPETTAPGTVTAAQAPATPEHPPGVTETPETFNAGKPIDELSRMLEPGYGSGEAAPAAPAGVEAAKVDPTTQAAFDHGTPTDGKGTPLAAGGTSEEQASPVDARLRGGEDYGKAAAVKPNAAVNTIEPDQIDPTLEEALRSIRAIEHPPETAARTEAPPAEPSRTEAPPVEPSARVAAAEAPRAETVSEPPLEQRPEWTGRAPQTAEDWAREDARQSRMSVANPSPAVAATQQRAPLEAPKREQSAVAPADRHVTLRSRDGEETDGLYLEKRNLGDLLAGHKVGQGVEDILDKVRSNAGHIPTHTVHDSYLQSTGRGHAAGYYDPQQRHIVLSHLVKGDERNSVLFHEGLHAATSQAINGDPRLRGNIRSIMEDVARSNKNQKAVEANPDRLRYGFTNEHEFLAEGISNSDLEKLLREHQLSRATARQLEGGGGKGFIRNAWDGFVDTLRRALGLPVNRTTALEGLLRQTRDAMQLNRPELADRATYETQHKDSDLGKMTLQDLITHAGTSPQAKAAAMAEVMRRQIAARPTAPPTSGPPPATIASAAPPPMQPPPHQPGTTQGAPPAAHPAAPQRGFIGTRYEELKNLFAAHLRTGPASEPDRALRISKTALQHRGELDQLKERAEAILAKHDETVRAMSPADRREMDARIQGTVGPNPNWTPTAAQQAAMNDIKRVGDMWLTGGWQSTDKHSQMTGRANYLSGMYENSQAARTYFSGGQGGAGSARAKFFPDYESAIKAGLTPHTDNPLEMMRLYGDATGRYLAKQKTIEANLKDGTFMLGSPGQSVGAAGSPTPYVRPGNIPQHYVASKTTELGGRPLYMPEDVVHAWDNLHGLGYKGGPIQNIADSARKLNTNWTMWELALNAYHLTTMYNEGIINEVARGLEHIFGRGNIGEGVKAIAGAPFAPAYKLPKLGGEVQRKYVDSRNTDPIIKEMVGADYNPMGQSHASDSKLAQRAWVEHTKDIPKLFPRMISETRQEFARQGGNLRALATITPQVLQRAVAQVAHPLFNVYIPKLKAGAVYKNMEHWMAQNPNATQTERTEAMRRISNSVDNRFGEMNTDHLFMNKMIQQTAMTAMRSFSWTVGAGKEIGGGAGALARGTYKRQNPFDPKSKGYDPRAAYVVAFPMVISATSAAYQYLLGSGDAPTSWRDLYAPRTGGTTPSGTPEHMLTPGYQKDVVGWAEHPGREIYNKLGGFWQTAYELATGRNSYGLGHLPYIRPNATPLENLQDRASYVAGKVGPIGVKSIMEGPEKGSKIPEGARWMGFRRTGENINNPEKGAAFDAKAYDRDYKAYMKQQERAAAAHRRPQP